MASCPVVTASRMSPMSICATVFSQSNMQRVVSAGRMFRVLSMRDMAPCLSPEALRAAAASSRESVMAVL